MGDVRFAGVSQLAVSAALGGEVENHGAGGHAFYHFRGHEDRSFFAGDYGGGDYGVVFGDYFSEKFALFGVEGFVLGFGVAAGVLCV